MNSEKFIKNKTALITLIAACIVVLISLGVRQTFGLFFMDFKKKHIDYNNHNIERNAIIALICKSIRFWFF